jgi:hypothetical protein
MSLLMFKVYVNAACPSFMSMLLLHAACLCVSVQHTHTSCPRCMSVAHARVSAACPYSISMLYGRATCPCPCLHAKVGTISAIAIRLRYVFALLRNALYLWRIVIASESYRFRLFAGLSLLIVIALSL